MPLGHLFTCYTRLRWNLHHLMEFPSDSTKEAETITENFPVVQRPSKSGINSKYDGAEGTPSGEFSLHLDTRPCISSVYDFTEGLRAKVKCTSTWYMHKKSRFFKQMYLTYLVTGLADHASTLWGYASLILELWSDSHSTDWISWNDSILLGWWASEPEKSVTLSLYCPR
jgi:hypothetical protein